MAISSERIVSLGKKFILFPDPRLKYLETAIAASKSDNENSKYTVPVYTSSKFGLRIISLTESILPISASAFTPWVDNNPKPFEDIRYELDSLQISTGIFIYELVRVGFLKTIQQPGRAELIYNESTRRMLQNLSLTINHQRKTSIAFSDMNDPNLSQYFSFSQFSTIESENLSLDELVKEVSRPEIKKDPLKIPRDYPLNKVIATFNCPSF